MKIFIIPSLLILVIHAYPIPQDILDKEILDDLVEDIQEEEEVTEEYPISLEEPDEIFINETTLEPMTDAAPTEDTQTEIVPEDLEEILTTKTKVSLVEKPVEPITDDPVEAITDDPPLESQDTSIEIVMTTTTKTTPTPTIPTTTSTTTTSTTTTSMTTPTTTTATTTTTELVPAKPLTNAPVEISTTTKTKVVTTELPVKPLTNAPIEIVTKTTELTKPITDAPDLGIGVYIVEPKTDAAGMELHTILIISLVVLIVLICLGYYIWQKYFWEISCNSSRRPSQEDVGKGNYDALPQSDQPAKTGRLLHTIQLPILILQSNL